MDGKNVWLNYIDEWKQDPEFKKTYPDILNVELTAKLLGIGKRAVYALLRLYGFVLCTCKIGRHYAILRDCLLDQMALGNLDSTKGSRRKQLPSRQEVQKSLRKYMKKMRMDPEFKKKYREFLTVARMAELVPARISSIYEWLSRGLLDKCSRKIRRRIKILLVCLLELIARGELDTTITSQRKPEQPSPPEVVEIEYV